MLGSLRTQVPDSSLTIVLNSSVAGLLAGATDLAVLSVNTGCNRILRPLFLPWRYYFFARKHFRTRSFDVCLLPRRESDDVYATVLAYFIGPQRTVSFSEHCTPRKAQLNRGFDRLLTDAIPAPPIQPEVNSNLSLLERIGLSASPANAWLPVNTTARTYAREILPGNHDSYLAICPTSGHSELKQWGADRFAEVAAAVAASGRTVVLIGVSSDEILGRTIEAAANGSCINLIGQTTLQQMVAILERCDAFIGNDAGPMHVASALGIHTIAVFGPSCHHRFGPWSPKKTLLTRDLECSPCRTHQIDRCIHCIHPQRLCLTQIEVKEVVDIVSPPDGLARSMSNLA